MASPSPAAVEAIRAEVGDWSPSDAAIAGQLNAPAIANPAPQPTVPTPYTVAQVFGLLSAASVAKLGSIAFIPDVRDKIAANDRAGCALYVSLLEGGGTISQSEAVALMGVVQATQLDPSWPPQISWAQSVLGRPVDIEDIAASRPGA